MYPPAGRMRSALVLFLLVLIVILSVLIVVLLLVRVLVVVLIVILIVLVVLIFVLVVVLHNEHSFFIFGNYVLIMPHLTRIYACSPCPIAMQDGRAKHTGRMQTQR